MNRRPALRVGDEGIHAACCGTNRWQAQRGAATVFVNGKAAFRVDDPSRHCGGPGQLIEGSPNVFAGDDGGRRTAPPSSGGAVLGSAGAASGGPGSSAASVASGAASRVAPASRAAASSGAPSAHRAGPESGARSLRDAASPAGAASPLDAAQDISWLGFVLCDERGRALAGERWEVTASDGTRRTGALDDRGAAHVEGLPAGDCRVRFPDIDDEDISGGGRIATGQRHAVTARDALVRFVLRDDDGDLHVGKRYELEVEGERFTGTTGERGVIAHRVSRRSERGELRVWLSDEDCRRYRLRLTRARAS